MFPCARSAWVSASSAKPDAMTIGTWLRRRSSRKHSAPFITGIDMSSITSEISARRARKTSSASTPSLAPTTERPIWRRMRVTTARTTGSSSTTSASRAGTRLRPESRAGVTVRGTATVALIGR